MAETTFCNDKLASDTIKTLDKSFCEGSGLANISKIIDEVNKKSESSEKCNTLSDTIIQHESDLDCNDAKSGDKMRLVTFFRDTDLFRLLSEIFIANQVLSKRMNPEYYLLLMTSDIRDGIENAVEKKYEKIVTALAEESVELPGFSMGTTTNHPKSKKSKKKARANKTKDEELGNKRLHPVDAYAYEVKNKRPRVITAVPVKEYPLPYPPGVGERVNADKVKYENDEVVPAIHVNIIDELKDIVKGAGISISIAITTLVINTTSIKDGMPESWISINYTAYLYLLTTLAAIKNSLAIVVSYGGIDLNAVLEYEKVDLVIEDVFLHECEKLRIANGWFLPVKNHTKMVDTIRDVLEGVDEEDIRLMNMLNGVKNAIVNGIAGLLPEEYRGVVNREPEDLWKLVFHQGAQKGLTNVNICIGFIITVLIISALVKYREPIQRKIENLLKKSIGRMTSDKLVIGTALVALLGSKLVHGGKSKKRTRFSKKRKTRRNRK